MLCNTKGNSILLFSFKVSVLFEATDRLCTILLLFLSQAIHLHCRQSIIYRRTASHRLSGLSRYALWLRFNGTNGRTKESSCLCTWVDPVGLIWACSNVHLGSHLKLRPGDARKRLHPTKLNDLALPVFAPLASRAFDLARQRLSCIATDAPKECRNTIF